MPGADSAIGQGQTVALLLAAAGVILLGLALTREGGTRRASVRVRTRSALVCALMLTAGLALLLVRRLDPTALSQVLANVTAAMVAAAMSGRRPRWPAAPDPLDRRHDVLCANCPPHELSKELS